MKNAILFTDFFFSDYWPMVHAAARRGFTPIVNTPDLFADLERAGLPCRSWSEFMPADLPLTVNHAVQRLGGHLPGILEQPEAVEAFAYARGNVLLENGKGLLRKVLETAGQQVAVVETLSTIMQACDLRMVVMRSNVSGTQRAIQALAEQHGIPVLELAHGVVVRREERFELTGKKRLPGNYAAYGPRDSRHLADLGNDPAQLFQTGAVIWDGLYGAEADVDARTARTRVGLDPDRPVVLYAGTFAQKGLPAYAAEMAGLLRMNTVVAEGVAAYGGGVQFVVRPHPGELRRLTEAQREDLTEAYAAWLAGYGLDLALLDVNDRSICSEKVDLIRAADAVIVAGEVSSVIPEVMILGRPVVLIPWTGMKPSFTEADGVHVAPDAAALTAVLHRLIGDEAYRSEVVARQLEALPDINFGNDGGASERVAGLIASLAGPSDPEAVEPLPFERGHEGGDGMVAEAYADMTGRPGRRSEEPTDLDAVLALFDNLIAQSRVGEAAEVLAVVRDHYPSAPQKLLRAEGVLCYLSGDAGRAESFWQQAYELGPEDASLQLALGSLYLEQDRLEEAVRLLLDVTEAEPGEADAWLGWAMAAYRLGDIAAFGKGLEKAGEITPGHPLVERLTPLFALA
jgi:tetratricopeptide (TPR) repeat protein